MRQPLLALLAKEPAHGYELKLALEQTFGQAYASPNIGQIYVTLKRLEQDGLVEALQRDVDLPYVRRWIRQAEGLLKRELQFVAVSRLLCEQGQQGLPHDPVTSLSPEGPALRLTPRITRK